MTNFLLYLIFTTLAIGFFREMGIVAAGGIGVVLLIVSLNPSWRVNPKGGSK